ncbi:MAG: beta propeller repeat protein [Symbiobacteriia bacterium]
MDRTPNLGSEAVVRYPDSPAVAFIDQFRAYVALAVLQTTAEGTIEYTTLFLETKDSGETWTRRPLKTGGNHDVPINLFFQDGKRGWLMTESDANGGDTLETKRVFRTFDGGQSWTMVAKLAQ